MKLSYPRWIVCLLALIVIQISAIPAKYQTVYNEDQFLLEGILQVLAVDVDDDSQTEVLVTGKNYTGRELFVYCLEFNPQFTPSVKWRSPNLFEERSILWTAYGNFDGSGNQLATLTTSQINLYQFTPKNLRLIHQFPNKTGALAVTAGDLDADGVTELITARAGAISSQAYNCLIEVWKLDEHQLVKVSQSGLIGNVRGLTAGDLDNDGRSEIIVEVGLRLATGTLHIFNYGKNRLIPKTQFKLANNGAVYALKVRDFPEGKRLLTASTKGKLNLWELAAGKLTAVVPEFTLKDSFLDIEAADLNNDGEPELITVGYPRTIKVLSSK